MSYEWTRNSSKNLFVEPAAPGRVDNERRNCKTVHPIQQRLRPGSRVVGNPSTHTRPFVHTNNPFASISTPRSHPHICAASRALLVRTATDQPTSTSMASFNARERVQKMEPCENHVLLSGYTRASYSEKEGKVRRRHYLASLAQRQLIYKT